MGFPLFKKNKFDFINEDYLDIYPLNLGLHGPEEEGRTEAPTEHRKRKAREEEGRVFFSSELPQGALLIIGFSVLFLLSFYYSTALKDFFVKYLGTAGVSSFNNKNMGALLMEVFWIMLKFIIPVGLTGIFVTTLSTMIQTGFHVSTKQLKVNAKKIVPSLENFRKRTVFAKSQLINSVKNICQNHLDNGG